MLVDYSPVYVLLGMMQQMETTLGINYIACSILISFDYIIFLIVLGFVS